MGRLTFNLPNHSEGIRQRRSLRREQSFKPPGGERQQLIHFVAREGFALGCSL